MMDEGLIVDKIAVEIQSGKPIYDFWMNDSDFIGTHPRYNDIVGGSLTDFMAGDGKDITNPSLDLNDFIGLSFGTFTDGKLYQLPDQLVRQPLLVPLRLVPEKPDEIVEVEVRIGDVLAFAGHEIGERAADNIVVAGVRAGSRNRSSRNHSRLAGLNLNEILSRWPSSIISWLT